MELRHHLHFVFSVAILSQLLLLLAAPLQATTYKNPIIAQDAPDPSIIKGNDGYYYLFSTAERVFRSTDLCNWKYMRQVFDGGKRPTFVEGVSVYWAPCVTKQDGRYVLYFALSKWGGEDTASIGVATADKPEGPYTIVGDEGKLFTSSEIGVQNSIDPNFIEENGRKFIVWGSWHGIWLIELTADGLAVKNMKGKRQIAGTRFEAPYIYKRGRWFYLFCSIGACCEGERSTYETVVGRSTSLFGPYRTRNGESMINNAYDLFLTSNEPCIAPGHNSRIIEDEAGTTWITYHGYMRSDPDKGRVAWLDEVKWDEDEWPYIEGKGASQEALEGPVVKPFSIDVDVMNSSWGVEQGTLLPVDLTDDGQNSLIIAGQQEAKQGIMPWNTILRKNEQGQWATAPNGLLLGLNPSLSPADLDGDGRMELVALSLPHPTANPEGANNGIYIMQPDNSLAKADCQVEGDELAKLTAATVADINRDGRPDIIAVGPEGKNLVLLAQATESAETEGSAFYYQAVAFADATTTYTNIYAADFNTDGACDLFACSATEAELFLYDTTSNTFAPTAWKTTCPVPSDGGIAIADINYDSYFDIICTGTAAIACINDGTGHFAPNAETGLTPDFLNQNYSTSAANLFDWDGDGYADFLYQGENAALAVTTGAIWLGSTKGSFAHRYRYGAGHMAATTFLDWDGDGVGDLVTTGTTTDTHLFHQKTGTLLAVSFNPSATSRRLSPVSNLTSQVSGNTVHLSWKRGLKNQTYEFFVRDDQGRLYGNLRAYPDGAFAGRRKVLDHGNLGPAIETSLTLPAGHYTWGVQRVNGRYEGSAFATAEFTVEADGITEITSVEGNRPNEPARYNVLGQRIQNPRRGIHLLRYKNGFVRKTVLP